MKKWFLYFPLLLALLFPQEIFAQIDTSKLSIDPLPGGNDEGPPVLPEQPYLEPDEDGGRGEAPGIRPIRSFYSVEYWKPGKKKIKRKYARSLTEILLYRDVITKLELRFHGGAQLPDTIAQFTGVKSLELRFFDSTALPPALWKLTGLEDLVLSGWKTMEIPEELGQLVNLKKLRIYNSAGLPQQSLSALGKLQQLEMLEIHARLPGLPPEIGNLSQLQTLRVYAQLSALPPEIGKLQHLRTLQLQDNKITHLPPEFGNLAQLERLDLSKNQLETLPSSIGNCAQLTRLDLHANKISVLPPEIGKLSQLKTLELGHNQLTTLPAEIGNLSALDTLYLYGNRLGGLPASIGDLKNLRELNLQANPLGSLPPEIVKLDSLENFWLEKKGLTNLPDSIWKFANRTGLYISKIPARIAGRPLSWYLQRKDIDPFAKLYVQGKMSLSEDEASLQILDSLMTDNPQTAPFYLYVFHTLLVKDSGVFECVRFVREYDIFDMSERMPAYVRKNPCMFFSQVVRGDYKAYTRCWTGFAGGWITREEALGELTEKMRSSCGTRYAKDVEKFWPVYYSEK